MKKGKKMEYSIKGQISFDDYKNFLSASVIYKKHRLIILILCFSFIIYQFISTLLKTSNVLTAIIELTPLIVIYIAYFIIYKLFAKRNYKTDLFIQQEINYTFSEEGICWSSDRGAFNYKIADFRKFIFSKKLIAIYISNHKAILIPRHFFESKEQEEKIELFIKEKYITSSKV